MKTIIALLLASCVVSLAQTNTNNSDSSSYKNALLDATEQRLFNAARSGDTETIRLLLKKGADINAKDNGGNTALMLAALEGRTDVVKLLLDKGADVNAKNNGDFTALGSARVLGYTPIVQLLQQVAAIASSGKPVNAAVASGTNTDSSGYVTNAALLAPFTLTNSIGDVVTNAVLVKLTPNKFIYKTPNGGGTHRLDDLSTELQKRFGYLERRAGFIHHAGIVSGFGMDKPESHGQDVVN